MRKALLMGLISLLGLSVYGQQQGASSVPKQSSTDVIAPSPTAAALGKYGNIPVNLYNGIPNISVPLYTIKEGSLELPISLSYHASGVKVYENASWVGMGWSLNAGGIITRSIRGQDDFDASKKGYCTNQSMVEFARNSTICTYTTLTIFESLRDGWYDTAPDVYYYNINGNSGRFEMNANGHATILSEEKDVDIYYNSSTKVWKVYMPDGTLYWLGGEGACEVSSSTVTTTTSISKPDGVIYPNPSYDTKNNYISAWYLREINSPKSEKIQFGYSYIGNITVSQPLNQYSTYNHSQSMEFFCVEQHPCADNYSSYSTVTTTTQGYKLSSISFSNGKLLFTNGTRTDVQGDRMLSAMEIYSFKYPNTPAFPTSTLERRFEFSYSNNPESLTSAIDDHKIWLHNIKEIPASSPPKYYHFKYYGSTAPDKIDAWGYYSSKPSANNTSAASVDINNVRFGTLNKITYPTGGSTEFVFDSHYSGNPSNSYEYQFESLNKTMSWEHHDYPPYYNNLSDPIIFESDGEFLLTLSNIFMTPSSYGMNNVSKIRIDKVQYGSNQVLQNIRTYYSSNPPNQNTPEVIGLSTGRYKISIEPGSFSYTNSISFNCSASIPKLVWLNMDGVPGGGIRIKSVTDYNGEKVTNKKQYTYSGGKLMSEPTFTAAQTFITKCDNISANYCLKNVNYQYASLPLSTGAQGSHVGYDKVSVAEIDHTNADRNGRIVNYFINQPENYPYASAGMYAGNENIGTHFYPLKSSKNGKLTKQEIFTGSKMTRLTENTYTTIYDNKLFSPSIFIRGVSLSEPEMCRGLDIISFNDWDDWSVLASSTETIFSQNNEDALVSETNYTYESGQNPSHHQLKTKKVSNSDGSYTITKYYYPEDYTISASSEDLPARAEALLVMAAAAHVYNQPVETIITRVEPNGNEYVIGGTYVDYQEVGTYDAVPRNFYTLQLSTPIPVANFNFSINNNTATPDSRYIRNTALTYETGEGFTNIIQINKPQQAEVRYIWNTDSKDPIVEISNSKPDLSELAFATPNKVRYWGFEPGALSPNNEWQSYSTNMIKESDIAATVSKTGQYYMEVQPSSSTPWGPTVEIPTDVWNLRGKYKFSAWVKGQGRLVTHAFKVDRIPVHTPTSQDFNFLGDNEWHYIEVELDLDLVRNQAFSNSPTNEQLTLLFFVENTNATASMLCDEMRVYPSNTLLKTFTYKPLYGISSMTDANNITTYYEYDDFGRLKLTRDYKGNVTNMYQYKYR